MTELKEMLILILYIIRGKAIESKNYRTSGVIIMTLMVMALFSLIVVPITFLLVAVGVFVFQNTPSTSETLSAAWHQVEILTSIITFLIAVPPLAYFFYLRTAYTKDELRYLPSNMKRNKTFKSIVNALAMGDKLFHSDADYQPTVFATILGLLFETSIHNSIHSGYISKHWEKYKTYDLENMNLWLDYLASSPYVERLSLLSGIEGELQEEAFKNRSDAELSEFIKPFNEFLNVMVRIRNDNDFREKELNKLRIITYDAHKKAQIHSIQEEMDRRVQFAMKDMHSSDSILHISNTISNKG